MSVPERHSLRRFLVPAIGLAILGFVRLRGSVPAWVRLHRWLAGLGLSRDARNLDASGLLLGVAFGTALVLRRGSPRSAARTLGLAAPAGRAFLVALVFAAPMLLVSAFTGRSPRVSPELLAGGILAPFTEEVFFRGLLCGVLVLAADWKFWPAAGFGGLLFGLSHIPWTTPPSWGSIPVVLITGSGGVWFAWLLRRSRFNLWVPIFLHALMNVSWMLFGVGGGAVGGLVPNLGRAATIALAIVGSLYPGWIGLPRHWFGPEAGEE